MGVQRTKAAAKARAGKQPEGAPYLSAAVCVDVRARMGLTMQQLGIALAVSRKTICVIEAAGLSQRAMLLPRDVLSRLALMDDTKLRLIGDAVKATLKAQRATRRSARDSLAALRTLIGMI